MFIHDIRHYKTTVIFTFNDHKVQSDIKVRVFDVTVK